jgi:hypothetical protein
LTGRMLPSHTHTASATASVTASATASVTAFVTVPVTVSLTVSVGLESSIWFNEFLVAASASSRFRSGGTIHPSALADQDYGKFEMNL